MCVCVLTVNLVVIFLVRSSRKEKNEEKLKYATCVHGHDANMQRDKRKIEAHTQYLRPSHQRKVYLWAVVCTQSVCTKDKSSSSSYRSRERAAEGGLLLVGTFSNGEIYRCHVVFFLCFFSCAGTSNALIDNKNNNNSASVCVWAVECENRQRPVAPAQKTELPRRPCIYFLSFVLCAAIICAMLHLTCN